MALKDTKKLILITVVVTAAVSGALFWAAIQFAGLNPAGTGPSMEAPKQSPENGTQRKILYWRAPMDPMEIYDEPGKSKMGMDLVPVYEDEVTDADSDSERKILYWRAPMDPTEIYDEPGKSKMGMELVPVYEDELVGGVDVKIDPVVEQNMGLRIEPAGKGPLRHTIQTYGHITFDETRTHVFSLKTGGWIEELHADYTGMFVNKDYPLFEVYSPALVAGQEEYLNAWKNYRKNKSSLNREILLSAEQRLHYFDIAQEEISRLEQTGQIKKTLTVRSPSSGVITHKNAVEGSYAKAGATLFTISDLSHVWVEAHIFEYEQHLVSVGQEVEMSLSYYPEQTYKGTVTYIFPYLDPKTRDITIRIDFENKSGELKPDMFARIKIRTEKDKEGIYIPAQSVIHTGEGKIVFVPRGNGRFSPRQIETGLYLDGGNVEVVSGLAEGEKVVVSGQFLLDSESRLKEAIQKMMAPEAQEPSGPDQVEDDAFFDDMEPQEDFFDDME